MLVRSSSGPANRETAAELGQDGRHPVERIDPHPQQRAVGVVDDLGQRRGDAPRRLVHGQVEQHLDLPFPGHARERAGHVLHGIEVGGRRERGGVDERRPPDPVDPERAQVVPHVVVRCQIPAAAMDDQAVRAELALGLVSGERAIRDVQPPTAADRVCEQQHRAGVGRRGSPRAREAEGLLERLHLASERRRQHPVDLRERAVDRRGGAVVAGAAVRKQPEHDDDRLLVGEHQRRQPVAGADPVAAADAALPLDGDAELLQHADVAPRRARVDAEAVGDLAPGRERPRLQQLEQLEQSGGGRGHGPSQARIEGVNRPI